MKIELVLIENRPVGYNLVPEKPEEQDILKAIQSLHFLADDKQKRIKYDGITTNKQGKPDCMFFMQHKYAILPPESELRQLILKMSGKYIPQVDKPEGQNNSI